MEINFKNKIIVVTGAGQGIGRELCKRLYNSGAIVYAFSRSPGPLNELKSECPNIITVSVDLSDWQKTRESFAILNGKTVDGLVNNAAIAIIKPFLELTEKNYDDTFAINFKGLFNVSQIVVPLMNRNGTGSIVNISSAASIASLHGHSAYSATKAAVDSLTKTLALELGEEKIRVNSVNPTVIMTKMGRVNWSDSKKSEPLLSKIPLHRFGEVDEVIDAVVFLLSNKSSYINGHCLPVEGGLLVS